MPVVSQTVNRPADVIVDFVSENGSKLMRYFGVSAINVLSGQGLLAFGLKVMGFAPVPAQFFAATVSAIPAYILSRRWVWRQSGRDSFRTEVLPFWTMALVGLVFALGAIALVSHYTESVILLMLTSLSAYGVVWVAKYFVMDKLMWGTGPASAPQ